MLVQPIHNWSLGAHPGTSEAAKNTPPKFNIAPEEWWLENEFPFGIGYF